MGHSEGTTQFFLGASLNPDYFTDKVNLFVGLAPVGSTSNISIPYVRTLAKFSRPIEWFAVNVLHMSDWFAPMPRIMELLTMVCGWFPTQCDYVASLVMHPEAGVDNVSRLDVFLSNEPSGVSYRTFAYYFQMINSGRNFTMYDFGKA